MSSRINYYILETSTQLKIQSLFITDSTLHQTPPGLGFQQVLLRHSTDNGPLIEN